MFPVMTDVSSVISIIIFDIIARIVILLLRSSTCTELRELVNILTTVL
jgi:hypothetical protein